MGADVLRQFVSVLSHILILIRLFLDSHLEYVAVGGSDDDNDICKENEICRPSMFACFTVMSL